MFLQLGRTPGDEVSATGRVNSSLAQPPSTLEICSSNAAIKFPTRLLPSLPFPTIFHEDTLRATRRLLSQTLHRRRGPPCHHYHSTGPPSFARPAGTWVKKRSETAEPHPNPWARIKHLPPDCPGYSRVHASLVTKNLVRAHTMAIKRRSLRPSSCVLADPDKLKWHTSVVRHYRS